MAQARGAALTELAYADYLPQIALHQMDNVGWHGLHRDFDMQVSGGPVGPHPVGHQVAFSKGLQHAGQQPRGRLGIEDEAHGDSALIAVIGSNGHNGETPTKPQKWFRIPAAVQPGR